MTANPEMIKIYSTRNKCWMCKHKFKASVILPVQNPQRGEFQPNFNANIFFHLYETHGIPAEIARRWVIGKIYGQELTLFGYR